MVAQIEPRSRAIEHEFFHDGCLAGSFQPRDQIMNNKISFASWIGYPCVSTKTKKP
jgi:hypothetical protein